MSKWVKVPITMFVTYAVEIEDDKTAQDAESVAVEDCRCDVIETGVTVMESETEHADDIKRHADKILAL